MYRNRKPTLFDVAVLVVVLTSTAFNTAYLSWGLPGLWHPDEITKLAVQLLYRDTLNPHSFAYPSLQIYLVYFLTALPYSLINPTTVADLVALWPDQSGLALKQLQSEVTLHAKVLTALMGSACVYLTYRTGRLIFDRAAGLIAAALLATSAGFIGLSHFATVDIPVTFWTVLCFYLIVSAFKSDGSWRYHIAAFAIGLAISTKYTAVLLLPTLCAAYLLDNSNETLRLRSLQPQATLRMYGGLFAWAAVGFFLGTPFALLDPLEFLKDFIQLQFYQPAYAGGNQRGYIPHIQNVLSMAGAFGAMLCAGGVVYAVHDLIKKREPTLFLLMLTIAVYYLKMGHMMFHPQRYIVPILPLLMLLAGRLCSDLLAWTSRRQLSRVVLISILCIGFTFNIYYATMGILRIAHDSRSRAKEWVAANVSPQQSIEISPGYYGVRLPREFRNVSIAPYYHVKPATIRLNESPVYAALSKVFISLKGGKDVANTRAITEKDVVEPVDVSLSALLDRKPRFLVLSKLSYQRFIDGDEAKQLFPLQHELYSSLIAEMTPYRLVADFERQETWLLPEMEFIDTGVKIFEHR